VEMRQVRNDYTFRFDSELYQIERGAIVSGMRGAEVRVEKRLDGVIAVRYGDQYVPVKLCAPARNAASAAPSPVQQAGRRRPRRRGSDWNKNFDLKKAPKVW